MKLKKLLAAVTAAALAVTTMAVASFTASAADTTVTLFPSTANGDVIGNITFSAAANTAIKDATSKVEVSLTGSIDDASKFTQFALQKKGGEWDTLGFVKGTGIDLADSKVTVTSDDESWETLKASDEYQLYGENIHATAVTVTVDEGDPITAWTYTKVTSFELVSGWNTALLIPQGDLAAAGLTAENLENSSIKVTCTGAAADSQAILKNGSSWADIGTGVYFADNSCTLSLATDGAAVVLTDGLRIGGCNATITKVELIISTGSQGSGEGGEGEGGDTPTPPPAGGSALWEGTAALEWTTPTVVNISADKFASVNAGDTVKVTFTPGDGASFKFMTNTDGWPTLVASSSADPTYSEKWETVAVSTSPYNLVIASDDIAALKATGMVIGGQNATVTKVELVSAGGGSSSGGDEEHTHTGGTATCQAKAVCTVCGLEYGEFAAHTYANGVCTVCGAADPEAGSGSGSGSGSTPSAPSTSTPTTSSNPTSVSQTTIIDKILATPDGGSGSVTLGSSTKVDKLAIEAIATKGDVTIKLNVAGGAYWEINGKNVTDAKDVNLGVKVNSKLIPESKVEAFAGEKTTIQLSLSHNGDFGFTGTLNVPVGNSNNGKFANLYYYHGGKFDFVGSSPIKGGRTQFAFSHASNYLIVIDDYAYGEDVSSAAGMTETTTETNTVPYVAVLVVISAFGASAIVLKKRLSK